MVPMVSIKPVIARCAASGGTVIDAAFAINEAYCCVKAATLTAVLGLGLFSAHWLVSIVMLNSPDRQPMRSLIAAF
jgi:hypothetical protein